MVSVSPGGASHRERDVIVPCGSSDEEIERRHDAALIDERDDPSLDLVAALVQEHLAALLEGQTS